MTTTGTVKPHLLFLSHHLPYPLTTGASVRTYHTLRILAERYRVTFLGFDKPDPGGRAARLEHLSRFGEARVFEMGQTASRWRLVTALLSSAARREPFTHRRYSHPGFDRALADFLFTDPPVLVHLDSLDLGGHIGQFGRVPVACTHHNVESQLLRRRSAAVSPGPARWFLADQANLMDAEERTLAPRMALNVMVSDEDAQELLRLAPGSLVLTVPNGVDTTYYRPGSAPVSGCVFVGGTTWFPNRDALAWYAEAILPPLRASLGTSVQTTWVGTTTERDLRRFGATPGLRLTGTVPDVRPYLAEAACVVVPLRVGGGTRLKILEAWAMGKAVVSTRRGAEGLAVREGENIFLADDAASFQQAIRSVLTDDRLRRRLGEAARVTALDRYSWDVVGEKLLGAYAGLTGG